MKVVIEIGEVQFDGEIHDGTFTSKLPIVGVTRRHGDEQYFIVNYDAQYDSETMVFEVGDIVYWRSEKSWKQAIALFFGNTPDGDGSLPRTPSGAIKIGHFRAPTGAKDNLSTGDIGRIFSVLDGAI